MYQFDTRINQAASLSEIMVSTENFPPEDSTSQLNPMDENTKRQKVTIPEGMSKNAWKKLQKQQRWDEQKDEFRLRRREKKRASRQKKAEQKSQGVISEGNNYHQDAKKVLPASQIPSGIAVVMDCEFDDLMSEKEIVSLSNQITRCYSAKRHSQHEVDLVISSFNKRLRQRFEKSIQDYSKWKGIQFKENNSLAELLPEDETELAKYVYLTADTDEELVDLKEGHTYIIGGIVDKNRHKRLCLDKAKELGLKVGRLPIGKYIQMNSRHVLATSHVYEIMCMWFESNHDWEAAFNSVLPPRKLRKEVATGRCHPCETREASPNRESGEALESGEQ